MKKTFHKPHLKIVRLLGAESLMNGSNQPSTNELTIKEHTALNYEALSNKESEYDIWGNSGNSIW